MLVVVSIIVLLVAMLLPALGKARESAKRTVCQTLLSDIHVGLSAYVVDSHGRYPPGNATIGRGYGIDSTYVVPLKRPMGLAFVIEAGYADPSLFYCPSWTHPWNQLGGVDTGGNDWVFGPNQMGGYPSGTTGGPTSHRGISYHYRSSFGASSNRPASLSRDGGGAALTADHFSRREVLYGRTYGHGGGYNTMFLSGSVAWLDDPGNVYMDTMQPGPDYSFGQHTNGAWALQDIIWQQFFEQ